jgi:5-oxoprolinase (ATP-hydrolysing) subunit A
LSRFPVNINCDLGEGLDNEAQLMPLIHSCNIACGGHAGDMATMKRVIDLARNHHVAIGAHPSYPDRENFGRVSLKMDPGQFLEAIRRQMTAFTEALGNRPGLLHHIKAHGALYNDLALSSDLSETYLHALEPYRDQALLYVPFNSVIGRLAAAAGFHTATEAFGDRNYQDDLQLVSRKSPDALITDKKLVLEHVSNILKGKVRTVSGKLVSLHADTICIHSDTENAVEILEYLKNELI